MAEKARLVIKVNSAKLDRDVCTYSNMDPYVIVNVNNFTQRTKTIMDSGKNPFWNESYEISPESEDDVLTLKVLHDDGGSGDELIGQCQIKLSQLMQGTGTKDNYTLLYKNQKAGEIEIESDYTPAQIQQAATIQYVMPTATVVPRVAMMTQTVAYQQPAMMMQQQVMQPQIVMQPQMMQQPMMMQQTVMQQPMMQQVYQQPTYQMQTGYVQPQMQMGYVQQQPAMTMQQPVIYMPSYNR